MASKRKKVSLRAFRSDVAKLRKVGLTKVSARTARPTKYMQSLIKKNRDVIEGRAKVVKIEGAYKRIASDIKTRRLLTKSRIIAEEHGIRRKAGRVIVPHVGTPVKYNPRSDRFETTVTRAGKRVNVIIVPKTSELHELERQGFVFQVPFARGKGRVEYRTFHHAANLLDEMRRYAVDRQGHAGYADWRDHMLIMPRGEASP